MNVNITFSWLVKYQSIKLCNKFSNITFESKSKCSSNLSCRIEISPFFFFFGESIEISPNSANL